jgi:hypothetical protein
MCRRQGISNPLDRPRAAGSFSGWEEKKNEPAYPEIDQWYQDSRNGALFEIVAIDTDEGTVEVQYLDGEIAEFDLDSWGELVLLKAAAPEDWSSSYEVDRDLVADPDATFRPTVWGNPLSRVEPEATLGIEDF